MALPFPAPPGPLQPPASRGGRCVLGRRSTGDGPSQHRTQIDGGNNILLSGTFQLNKKLNLSGSIPVYRKEDSTLWQDRSATIKKEAGANRQMGRGGIRPWSAHTG